MIQTQSVIRTVINGPNAPAAPTEAPPERKTTPAKTPSKPDPVRIPKPKPLPDPGSDPTPCRDPGVVPLRPVCEDLAACIMPSCK